MKRIYTVLSFLLFGVSGLVKAQPCTGAPASNSIVAQYTMVCAGDSAHLSLANNYPGGTGYSYQWQQSNISLVGPWTTIPGATLNTYVAPPFAGTKFFNVVITCTNSSQSISAATQIWVTCAGPCGSYTTTPYIPSNVTGCLNDSVSYSLGPLYPNSGYQFQWYYVPASNWAPVAIPGATLSTFTSGPLSQDTLFMVDMNCLGGGGTFTMSSAVSLTQCCTSTPPTNTVVGSQTICAGSSASLGLASNYAVTLLLYQWQSSTVSAVGPFVSIPTATLPTYTSPPLNTTTYYNLVVTCFYSSQSISLPHTVSVISCTSSCVADASFSLVPTNTVQVWNALPALTSGIAAAQWQWGDGSTSNSLFTSHQYSAAGMYNICLSVTLTCGTSAMSCSSYSVYRSASGIIQVHVLNPVTMGLNESTLFNKSLEVFPNPGSGHFTVKFDGSTSPAILEISSLTGQVVYRAAESGKGASGHDIDLTALQDGIYLLKVTQDGQSALTRISLQK